MTDGRPEALQAASTTTKLEPRALPPSPQAASATVKSAPSPISTTSTRNVKRSAHRTNTSNDGDRPAPTGPFDYPITLKTTLL